METFHWFRVLTAVSTVLMTAFAGALKGFMYNGMMWAHKELLSFINRPPGKPTTKQKAAFAKLLNFLYGVLFTAVVLVFILKNGKIDISQAYYSSDDLAHLCEYPKNSNYDGRYFPVYKSLLDKYPQFVNIRDTNGLTPLMRACDKGNTNLAMLFLASNYLDINATNFNGWNALRYCTNIVENTTNDDGTIMIKTEQKITFMKTLIERENTWFRQFCRKIRIIFSF